MVFTVRFKDEDGWLEFSRPLEVLRAPTRDDLDRVLDAAQGAMSDGLWVAGVVPYEGAGAAIGIFDEPARPLAFECKPFRASPPLASVSRDDYAGAIDAIKRAIYDGDVYQVNFTVPFAFAVEGDAFSLWHTLALHTHARYQAYVEDGDRRILSWSPELFLAFDGARVTTKPMKGTSPPDDTSALLEGKNRAEHIMIVDLLRNDLRRFCTDVDVTHLCTIERYPTFATMTSTIEGTVEERATLTRIFTASFPCGSITGAPKRAAMDAIARLEARERGAYCGAIGFLSPQRRGWWNVAIRTAQLDGERGRFDAGGGIVSDSNAVDEWNEVLIKSSFIRAQAENFELWETFSGDADPKIIDAHLARLADAAARVNVALDIDGARTRAHEAAAPGTIVRMRLALNGAIRIVREPLLASDEPVEIRIAAARVRSDDPWLAIKSSFRPAARAAWREAEEHACFDALLVNERGELTEGSRTNFFFEIGGTLYTPPLRCGLLPGILRSRILAEGRAHERVLRAREVHRASALYVGNSARGLLRARLQS